MTPLLLPALSLLAGAITGFYLGVDYSYFLIVPVFLFSLFLPPKLRTIILLCGFFMLGESLAFQRKRELLQNPFPQGIYQDFEGKMLRSPEYYKGRTRLYIKTPKGKVLINVSGEVTGLYPGDKVEGSTSFSSADHPCNFGIKNRYRFYSGVVAMGGSKTKLFFRKKESPFPWCLLHPLYKLKEKTALRVSHLPPYLSGVISALLLGQRFPLVGKVPQSLKRAGLYHLMAISGTHIALFTYLIWLISGLFLARRRPRFYITAGFLLMFYLWVEPSPSVVRATIMALLVLVGKILWRDISLLNIISASLILSLILNPLGFLSPGFQLTYWVSLGLILFAPLFKSLPYLTRLTAFSTVAFLFSLPLSLYHFHRGNFLSPLNNLIGITLVPFIILLSIPALSGLNFLWKPIGTMVGILSSLDSIGFSLFTVPSLPWPLVAAAMGLLLISRKKPILAPLVLALALFPSGRVKTPGVLFLDVGQGDAVLVKCPPAVFLYDAGGGRGRTDVGEFITSRVLWEEGIKTLDAVFISHFHPDHAAGAVAVLKNFRVKTLYYSKRATGPLFREIFSLASRAKSLRKGEVLRIGSCKIKVLYPEKLEPGPAENSDSLVLLVKNPEFSLLLTGDIEKNQEEKILPLLTHVSVLKVPHHGSRTSSTLAFLRKLTPLYSVISAGKNNPYGFPSPEALERLKKYSRRVLSTSRCGAIRIRGRRIQTCLPCAPW